MAHCPTEEENKGKCAPAFFVFTGKYVPVPQHQSSEDGRKDWCEAYKGTDIQSNHSS